MLGDEVSSGCFLETFKIIFVSSWCVFRLGSIWNTWTLAHTCVKQLENHCCIPCMLSWYTKVSALRRDTITASIKVKVNFVSSRINISADEEKV